jgi:hypothetical protein
MVELIIVFRDGHQERKEIVSQEDFNDAMKIMEKFQESNQTEMISATLNMKTSK